MCEEEEEEENRGKREREREIWNVMEEEMGEGEKRGKNKLIKGK